MSDSKIAFEAPVFLPENWSDDAESNDFDVQKLWSCAYYIAENTYGFTCTHRDWTPEWYLGFYRDMRRFHGPKAARTVQTLVDFWGLAGCQLSANPSVGESLLKLAIIQSEQHRGIRA